MPPESMAPLGSVLSSLFPDLTRKRLEALGGTAAVERWTLVSTTLYPAELPQQLSHEEALVAEAAARLADPALTPTLRAHFTMAHAQHAQQAALLRPQVEQRAAYEAALIATPHEPDCFCLGLGGRGQLRPIVQELVWYDPVTRQEQWCPCSVGQQLRAQWEQACAVADAQDRAAQAELAAETRAARQQYLLQRANLPRDFAALTLDTFPVAPENAAVVGFLRGYGRPGRQRRDDGAWEEGAEPERGSLYLWGDPSRGKTGLAQAAAREWIAAGREARFEHVSALLGRLKATFVPNPAETTAEVLAYYSDVPLLVLDDLGAEKVSEWVREQFDTLINARKQRRPSGTTLFTSNYPLRAVAERFSTPENPRGGERIVERIAEMCNRGARVVFVDGPNLRWSEE